MVAETGLDSARVRRNESDDDSMTRGCCSEQRGAIGAAQAVPIASAATSGTRLQNHQEDDRRREAENREREPAETSDGYLALARRRLPQRAGERARQSRD